MPVHTGPMSNARPDDRIDGCEERIVVVEPSANAAEARLSIHPGWNEFRHWSPSTRNHDCLSAVRNSAEEVGKRRFASATLTDSIALILADHHGQDDL